MADIFLQHVDGAIESISVTAGSQPNRVVLGHAPRIPLVVNDDHFAKPTYILLPTTGLIRGRERAFLVAEVEPKSNMTCVVKAINYDSRYYTNDADNPTEDTWPWTLPT